MPTKKKTSKAKPAQQQVVEKFLEVLHELPDLIHVTIATDASNSYRLATISPLLTALWDWDQAVRNKLKYCEPDKEFTTASAALEWARTSFYQALDDAGVNWELLQG